MNHIAHTTNQIFVEELRSYRGAKYRCTNPRLREYKYYGGRGIEFRFNSFGEFLKELGPRPDGYTLDRIDNEGHYEPGNVRWADAKTQAGNRVRAPRMCPRHPRSQLRPKWVDRHKVMMCTVDRCGYWEPPNQKVNSQ